MKAKDWVVMFQGFDPDEEVIAIVYDRSLFADSVVCPITGEELGECPKSDWDVMAQNYEVRDYVAEQVWDDIVYDLQGTMTAFAVQANADADKAGE